MLNTVVARILNYYRIWQIITLQEPPPFNRFDDCYDDHLQFAQLGKAPAAWQ